MKPNMFLFFPCCDQSMPAADGCQAESNDGAGYVRGARIDVLRAATNRSQNGPLAAFGERVKHDVRMRSARSAEAKRAAIKLKNGSETVLPPDSEPNGAGVKAVVSALPDNGRKPLALKGLRLGW